MRQSAVTDLLGKLRLREIKARLNGSYSRRICLDAVIRAPPGAP
jgi:hypothetical protein